VTQVQTMQYRKHYHRYNSTDIDGITGDTEPQYFFYLVKEPTSASCIRTAVIDLMVGTNENWYVTGMYLMSLLYQITGAYASK
jgi:hypothetical protein